MFADERSSVPEVPEVPEFPFGTVITLITIRRRGHERKKKGKRSVSQTYYSDLLQIYLDSHIAWSITFLLTSFHYQFDPSQAFLSLLKSAFAVVFLSQTSAKIRNRTTFLALKSQDGYDQYGQMVNHPSLLSLSLSLTLNPTLTL